MDEFRVGSAEELKLKIKWLGPVSSKYARSIKVSNVNKPSVAVTRLWDRHFFRTSSYHKEATSWSAGEVDIEGRKVQEG